MADGFSFTPVTPAFTPVSPVSTPVMELDPWELPVGATAENPHPEMHPDLTKYDRFAIMTRGGNPEVGQRHLEGRGFQVKPKGGFQYALQKGKSDWYLFDEEGASFQDISDVGGDVLSLTGMIGGAALTAPTGFTAGVLGAGGGTAAAQGVRTGIGEAMGVSSRAADVPGEILREGLAGAAGQVLGVGGAKLLRGAGRMVGRARAGTRTKRLGKLRAQEQRRLIDEGVPLTADPGATAATTAEMASAIKALNPTDPAVIQFIRRTDSRRTSALAGHLEKRAFQGTPPEDAAMRQLAQQTANTAIRNRSFSHMTEAQLGELLYRREVHGLTKRGFSEAVRLAKGMPAREVDDMVRQLSQAFPFKPASKNLLGPMVDIEARATATRAFGGVPRSAQVDFWRFIPIEGLRKVTLPGGEVLQLTASQAAAAKHIVADIGVFGIPFRKGVGKLLTRLGQWLQVPRTLLFRGLQIVGLPLIKKFNSKTAKILPSVGQVAGVSLVTPVGAKVMAGAHGMAFAGGALEKLGARLANETTGEILSSMVYKVSMRVSRRIQQVLRYAGGQKGGGAVGYRPGLYRLGVYELMKDPEFTGALQEMIGAPDA